MSTEENKTTTEHTETEIETASKNLIWPEIKKAAESKRYELCLVGSEISQRIESNGGYLDSNLYKLTHLNFLEIAKTKLSAMPKQIGQIKNLTSLLCHTNELTSIPIEIGLLSNLKNLDFSNNKITSLPSELSNLKELFTINLSGNQLTELFPLNDLVKLSVLDISRNKLQKLPPLGSCNLENLSEINGSYNELVEIPEDLVDLPSLKLLNLQNNQITHVPSNLSQCNKLKDLLLKENKIKDNRLKKLIEQDQKTKSILDYLKKIYDEEAKSKPKKTSTDKAKNNRTSKTSLVQEYDLLKVVHFNDEKLTSKQVMIMDTVNEVRPYILCTILRDIDLESGNNLKNFLTIQVCFCLYKNSKIYNKSTTSIFRQKFKMKNVKREH
jgi:Leucine-rich repeat (LRR) protein